MSGIAMAIAMSLTSTSALGKAEGICRRSDGVDILVDVQGLKDRAGLLRVELYPDNDADFLADDNVLIAAGKTFARVDTRVPDRDPVILCIRAPRPGRYSLSLLHDRDANLHFDFRHDGVGFPGNPRLGWSRPQAAAASITVREGINRIAIRLNYWRGLVMRPLDRP
jgi:uncharacterized protein (DUF2141 family)